MTKADFFNILKSAEPTKATGIIESIDALKYGAVQTGIFICWHNRLNKTLITNFRGNAHNNPKIYIEVDKYKKWLKDYQQLKTLKKYFETQSKTN